VPKIKFHTKFEARKISNKNPVQIPKTTKFPRPNFAFIITQKILIEKFYQINNFVLNLT